MPRAKRRPKKKLKVIEKEDSDVDAGHDTPDPESEEFFYDDVDKFHTSREKILLDRSLESSDEESEGFEQVEDVLGLDTESDEDDNDDEIHVPEESLSSSDEDMEKGIPSEKAWGKKKKVYYDADQYKDKDLDSEGEEALDNEEEEEVLMLQQNMAARLDEDDFDMEEFELTNNEVPGKQKAKVEKAQQEKITMDLSKLSKEEKIKLLTKDSPELFELMGDFKEKLIEVEERLLPLVQMARAGKITNPQGVEYLEMKHQLIMNYLVNVCFYLLLKAHQTPVKNHPVIERLVEYRELLQQMEILDVQLNDDIEYFLKKYKGNSTGETLTDFSKQHELNTQGQKKKVIKKKVKFSKSKSASEVQSDEVLPSASAGGKRKKLEDLDPLSYYEAIRDMKKKRKEERMKSHLMSMKEDVDNIDDEADEEIDGKRGITYQISKNKGLTPKRKKEVRNPRLKHRKKYIKAKIKRKSQVNPVVKELTRYGGEETGIKTHLTRSIKIK